MSLSMHHSVSILFVFCDPLEEQHPHPLKQIDYQGLGGPLNPEESSVRSQAVEHLSYGKGEATVKALTMIQVLVLMGTAQPVVLLYLIPAWFASLLRSQKEQAASGHLSPNRFRTTFISNHFWTEALLVFPYVILKGEWHLYHAFQVN